MKHALTGILILLGAAFPVLAAAQPPVYHLAQADTAKFEERYWNQANKWNRAEGYKSYLRLYPDGRHADEARRRLAQPDGPDARIDIEPIDLIMRFGGNGSVNIRAAPDTNSKIVGRGKTGRKIHVTGTVIGKDWFRVSLGLDKSGFVYAPLLGGGRPVASRPVVSPSRPAPLPKKRTSRPKYSTAELREKGMAAAERKNFKLARRYLGPAALRGDAESQFELGIIYSYNYEELTSDDAEQGEFREKGQKLLLAAAKKGYGPAQHAMGVRNQSWGRWEEAMRWFKLASDQGIMISSAILAHAYVAGTGVEKNIPEAKRLYRKLIDAGHTDFQPYLDRLEGR